MHIVPAAILSSHPPPDPQFNPTTQPLMTTFQFADDPLRKPRGRRPSTKPSFSQSTTTIKAEPQAVGAAAQPTSRRPSNTGHPTARPRRSSAFAGIINTSNGEQLSLDQILEEARVAEEREGGEMETITHGEDLRRSRASSESLSAEEDVVDETRIVAADAAAPSAASSNDQDIMNRIRRKRTRTVTTPFQSRVLRKVLAQTSFPSTEMRLNLATALGMNPRTVQIWFQNQRQKAKNRQAAQQEKWTTSNIFFHNLTVKPDARQPRRTSVPVTLDKILPPTMEDPTRSYLDGEHRKRRKSSSVVTHSSNATNTNITISTPNPAQTPTPTLLAPSTSTTRLGQGRPPKHTQPPQPPQFIMTATADDDMIPASQQQSHSSVSHAVVPLHPQHPLYAQPMALPPVFSASFVQHASVTAVQHQGLITAFSYASPAQTSAFANFPGLAQQLDVAAQHQQHAGMHHHHHTQQQCDVAAAAANNPFSYMMVPTLDLLASAALEDQGFVVEQHHGEESERVRASRHARDHMVATLNHKREGQTFVGEVGVVGDETGMGVHVVSVGGQESEHDAFGVEGGQGVNGNTWRPW